MVVSWFSAGVSSAVATKLMINDIDKIIYTHIDDQHHDTMRFVNDCEKWFGKEIEILQSPYRTVENAMRAACYVNGVHGAPCTRLLKRRVRQEWESDKTELAYVWGFDSSEGERCYRIRESMPNQTHIFPLINKNISKEEAHRILSASGIARPKMYEMGYHNNNCIGCVKGGMGYWNKIRVDFPDVFQKRAETERLIGATCIKGIYLDELSPSAGRKQDFIFDDCGVLCDALSI
jgi:hypothetical protein